MIVPQAPSHLNMGHAGPAVDDSVTKANNSGGIMNHYEMEYNSDNYSRQQHSKLTEDLRRQVEFYFSPMNYANDTYLQQYSAAYGGSVPLAVIASFPKVREIFAVAANLGVYPAINPQMETNFLVQALETSDVVAVSPDGLWITPIMEGVPGTPGPRQNNGPPQMAPSPPGDVNDTSSQSTTSTQTLNSKERTTVIVRDLPLDCETEDIMNIFSTDCSHPKSARPDVGNTWYVTFESESQALEALAVSLNRLIGGYPIKARLKSVAPPRQVEAKQHQYPAMQQHPRYSSMPLSQQHQYNHHHNAMAMHSQAYAIMPPYGADHMPYGMAAVYPVPNVFYMDHPQHLMPPIPPQMEYPAMDSNENDNDKMRGSNHSSNGRSQTNKPRNPNKGVLNNNVNAFVPNYHSMGNGAQSESDTYNYNPYYYPKKIKNTRNKKNKRRAHNKNKSNPTDTNGERRMEQQASIRGDSPTNEDSRDVQKERRENPSPSLVGTKGKQPVSSISNGDDGASKDNYNKKNDKYKSEVKTKDNIKHAAEGKKIWYASNNKGKKKFSHHRLNSTSSSSSSSSLSKFLNDDQFPALTTCAPKQKQPTVPQRPAYAEALLKPPAPAVQDTQTTFDQITLEEKQEDDAICW